MNMKTRYPAEVFPPGIFLEEELGARNLTQADFAEILGKLPKDVHNLIRGKVAVTPETALLLADALGINEQHWLNLESTYQAYKARLRRASEYPTRSAEVSLKAKLYEKFPVRDMLRRGWVQASSDVDVLIARFCQFADIPSLDSPVEVSHAARKGTEYSDSTPVQTAWLARAKQLARMTMLPTKFTPAKLKACKAKLRLLMHETEEIRKVPNILAEAGIRFVIVEFLPSGKMDGATLWLDDDSPVIAMSLLKDRVDNFWFVLMHEIDHVEHGEGKIHPIIDIDLCSQDSSDDLPEAELRANLNAAEFCISQDELQNFIVRTDPYYHQHKIEGFAYLHKIHPGIVVGQLQKRGRVRWNQHRKLLDKVRKIISEASLTDGYGFEVR
jgi:HTH-type transcriptional regulator/antitoxin HigA